MNTGRPLAELPRQKAVSCAPPPTAPPVVAAKMAPTIPTPCSCTPETIVALAPRHRPSRHGPLAPCGPRIKMADTQTTWPSGSLRNASHARWLWPSSDTCLVRPPSYPRRKGVAPNGLTRMTDRHTAVPVNKGVLLPRKSPPCTG